MSRTTVRWIFAAGLLALLLGPALGVAGCRSKKAPMAVRASPRISRDAPPRATARSDGAEWYGIVWADGAMANIDTVEPADASTSASIPGIEDKPWFSFMTSDTAAAGDSSQFYDTPWGATAEVTIKESYRSALGTDSRRIVVEAEGTTYPLAVVRDGGAWRLAPEVRLPVPGDFGN